MARFVLALLAVLAVIYSAAAAPALPHYPMAPFNSTFPAFPAKRAVGSHTPQLHLRQYNSTAFDKRAYNSTDIIDKRGYNTTETQKRDSLAGAQHAAQQRQARDFPNARVPLRAALGATA